MFLKLIFLITIINKLVNCGKNKNLIINQNTIEKDLDAIAIIFNLDLNNTSDEELNLEVRDGKCCLKNVGEVDCNMLDLVGCSDILPGGTSKTIKLISPILEPFQRKGYCTAHIDTWGNDKRKMKDNVKFNFDIKDDELNKPINKCDNLDEDPMNNCKPVNCDVHYNGHKPLYDSITKKCVKAVNCTDDSKILNPNINNCVDNTVKERDIEFIKSNINRKPKDILIISNIMKNNSRYTDDIDDMRKTRIKQNRASLNNLKAYFNCNRYMFSILGLVILVQCILICTMLYYVTKNCDCYKKKIVERKYFNYRQDVSVTTPLIGTSNIDTETIDYQCMSDSSNVDNKIKCYKACQKEKKNDIRVSLSDDILSKCINRRNWTQHRSETIPESKEDNYAKVFTPKSNKENKDIKINIDNINQTKSNTYNTGTKESIVKTENSSNVTDNEVTKVQSFSKTEHKPVDLTLKSGSEREIKCHSYSSNMTGFKPSVHSKNLGLFKTVKGASVSTEKSAQASFSNDSIDDFLSERGVVYLAGENLSKYSFSSSNPAKTSNTSMSSRTSKNNVVKNVLSLLRRKSKVTSSDPVLKKSKQNIDLELLHMSRASMFSSSNDSDKGFKRLKDSRTSL